LERPALRNHNPKTAMPGKRIQFDQETRSALDLLAKDSMRDSVHRRRRTRASGLQARCSGQGCARRGRSHDLATAADREPRIQVALFGLVRRRSRLHLSVGHIGRQITHLRLPMADRSRPRGGRWSAFWGRQCGSAFLSRGSAARKRESCHADCHQSQVSLQTFE
jgi:hypothetical protein